MMTAERQIDVAVVVAFAFGVFPNRGTESRSWLSYESTEFSGIFF